MPVKNHRYLIILLLVINLFTACQKSYNPTDTATTADDKLKDSVLQYARDIYLWYNQIPASFNARSYADPAAIMTAIQQYSMEPGFTKPVDRWSFAMKKTEWDNLSNGISADFGMGIFFLVEGDLRVKSVERESPAGKAGIHRGWRITKINGNTNITTGNSDFIVNNVYYSKQTTFTFIKPDGSSADIVLDAATYNDRPVMLDSVYTVSGKNIGYMVLSSFLGNQTDIYNEFTRVFNRFATASVNDVVIDLRYNGGGYVSIQQKLANYLAPTVANGSVMMAQKYNDKYTSYNVTTNFAKLGSLNLPRIIFIVSSSSASASELLINNLKPYMDVKLIGRNNTHGKPVGFFPIPVGEWYIFPVSFKSVNKNGDGNYYNGFTPDAIIADGLNKDWGDVTETSLASAIKYITTGSFRLMEAQPYVELPAITNSNSVLDAPNFKGTISTNKIFK